MENTTPASEHVLVARDGAIVTLTFNRPEARNAMTWDMYQRLYEACEHVDADDSVRVLVLKGAGGKAFVAGTDISQFTAFQSGEDGLRYEREGDLRTGRIARVKKPVIAQIQGFAVGGGLGIAAGADLRIATPDARFGAPIARTLGNCLSMRAYARYLDLFGPSRLKELIFTARLLSADEALGAGFVHEIVAAEGIEARVRELAQQIASHAPITLWVTKEAVRRIQEARPVPDGDDLIAATYGSADFREGVRAFVDKRPPRWTGKLTEAMPASTALSHLTVLDLTRVRAGPTAVRQLADWGAQVIKIEMPAGLDEGEGIGGPREDSDFQNVHRNKRGMTLNLKSPGGVEILKRLAARADVLVENFRPDVKDRLGIGYETMAAVNPRLVYASISGYGEDGPYRLRPGFDQIAQGMGGLMSITGLPGQGPVRVGIPIADLCAGIFCAYGITVALIEREQSGRGQWVKSSLLQAQLFMLDFQAARWLMKGEVPKQAGNNHPTSIPTGVYKTRDGYMNLAVAGHKIWLRMCQAIDAPELQTHPDYVTAALRSQHRDQLHADLEQRLQARDTADWIELLNQAGVPCGPIYSIDQAFSDPQTRQLGIVQKVGDVAYLGQPVTLSRTPSCVVAHPPARGEHTADVLRELGCSDAEIQLLISQGIV